MQLTVGPCQLVQDNVLNIMFMARVAFVVKGDHYYSNIMWKTYNQLIAVFWAKIIFNCPLIVFGNFVLHTTNDTNENLWYTIVGRILSESL